MSQTGRVTVNDLRAIVRLAGELHELPRDRFSLATHFVGQLREIFCADLAMIVEHTDFRPGWRKPPSAWMAVSHLMDRAGREAFTDFFKDDQAYNPVFDHLCDFNDVPTSHLRSEMVTRRDWNESRYFNEYARPARVGDSLAAVHPLKPSSRVLAVYVQRGLGDRGFGVRERNLLQVVNTDLGGFLRSLAMKTPGDAEASLPPHLRRTLDRILVGDSEKEAAAHLRLSRHSVHEYMKALHQRFAVRSRGELLSRVLRRNAEMPPGPAFVGNGNDQLIMAYFAPMGAVPFKPVQREDDEERDAGVALRAS